uniref:Uncharacterized protein n=1 Tax=Anguilla anguilla TaxID=7936 RepID=A0A0E9RZV0_ANGAN
MPFTETWVAGQMNVSLILTVWRPAQAFSLVLPRPRHGVEGTWCYSDSKLLKDIAAEESQMEANL